VQQAKLVVSLLSALLALGLLLRLAR